MSDLQLSLLVIGVMVIAGVYLYNLLVEHRYRRRMRQAFGSVPEDVLLRSGGDTALADGRLEPQLASAPRPAATAESPVERAPAPVSAEGFDAVLDYVAEIDAAVPVADALVNELAGRIASCGKPARIAGLDARTGSWEDAARARGARFHRLRPSLQLVNRAGAVSAAQLALFCDAVKSCADRASATTTCPDPQAAVKQAQELDALCADFDVAVGVNVVAAEAGPFAGGAIRAAAEAAGFQLEPDGVFHFRNEHRQTLFTLDNHDPAPFLPESLPGLTTGGVTLLLDVPRVANGAAVLERMVAVAGRLAEALDGRLVDDNRAPLTEAGLSRIQEQVRTIHAKMDLHGIPAGGVRAQRLFS